MTTGAMLCAFCGRPAETIVWVNGRGYHQECLHGPKYSRPVFEEAWQSPSVPMLLGITEQRLREIVREELAKGKQ